MPEPKKDFLALRTLLLGIQTQLCGTDPLTLEEPFRATFNGLKAEFEAALAKLPAAEPAPQDLGVQLQSLWSCFYSLNSLFNSLLGSTKAQKCAVETEIARQVTAGDLIPRAVLPARVTEQVTAQVTAGELVPKATVEQLCSVAKTNGLTEGEKKVRDEIAAKAAVTAKVAERTTALQTAGLPLPDAEIERLLGGTDEEFAAHRTRVEAHLAQFKDKGIQLAANSTARAKAWLAADAFKGFLALADGIPSLKGGGAEPFANGLAKSPASPGFFV